MIELNKNYRLTKPVVDLITFFNELEEELNQCNTIEEKRQVLYAAETELIMWDKV